MNSSSMQFIYLFIFIFLSFIWHNSVLNQLSFWLKLNCIKIEFQNRGTNLYSLEIGAYCQIFCSIGVKDQNLPHNMYEGHNEWFTWNHQNYLKVETIMSQNVFYGWRVYTYPQHNLQIQPLLIQSSTKSFSTYFS